MRKTIEEKVHEIISGRPYTLSIGGKDIQFRYATLDDLQKISALASKLPTIDSENPEASEVFNSFGYAQTVIDIILVTALTGVDTENSITDRLFGWFKKRKAKHKVQDIISQTKIVEIWATMQSILQNNHIFFYLDTITSLKGMNILKPTKETDLIART